MQSRSECPRQNGRRPAQASRSRASQTRRPTSTTPGRSRRAGERRPTGERHPASGTRPVRQARRTTPARNPQPQGRNRGLDGFRALAILAVLVYHLDLPWLPSGHLGVGMFLVLTGYLVTSSLLRRLRQGGAIPRFWLGRMARVWPPVALTIVLTVLACIIFNHPLLTKARPDILPGLALVENLSYILRNVSYFEQVGGPSPLTHLWYVGIDLQFALVWPLVMLVFGVLPSRSSERRATLVLALASAVAMALLYNPDAGITRVYYGPDTRAFAPLVGAWLAYAMPLGRRPARDLRPLLEDGRLVVELAALVSLTLIVVAMVLVPDTSALLYRGGMFVAALLSAVVLAAVVLPGGIISQLLSLPPLTWLGTRSFGVYLWHYPLIQLTRASDNGTPLWKIALVVVLSLVLAELTYRLVEQPVARALAPQPSTPRSRDTARSPLLLPAAIALGIVLVADGIGLAVVPEETLVPEDAIVSTGTDAGHAMDLSQSSTNDQAEDTTQDTTEQQPSHDTALAAALGDGEPDTTVVLRSDPAERTAGLYDPVLIADSVPGDAAAYWSVTFPDGLMDSFVGRRPDQALVVLDEYLEQGVVGSVVILQAFSNIPVSTAELDHMIAACGDRTIYLVNVRIPESEEAGINQTLLEAVNRYENVHLIDWHSLSEGMGDWIYPDGEHLTPAGQPVYIGMLADGVGTALIEAGGSVYAQGSEELGDVPAGTVIGSPDPAA